MQREYNKHTKKQKNTSANPPMTTPQGAQNKKKSIIKLNVKSNSRKQVETPTNIVFMGVRKLVLALMKAVFIFIIFSLFLEIFSVINSLFIKISVVSIPAPLSLYIKKLIKKELANNPSLIEFSSNIKNAFEKLIQKSDSIKKAWIIILITISAAFFISLSPKLTAATFAKIDVAKAFVTEIIEDISSDKIPSEEDGTDSIGIPTVVPNEGIDYPPQMSFILQKNNFEKLITPELTAESFLYNTDEPLEYLYSIYSTKESTNNTLVYYKAQKEEDDFTVAVNEGERYKKMYGQTSDWYDMLPKEQELWSVIEQQKSKAEIYPSNHIYNSLSNNYQRLAIEYHNQNENKETIKYLYLLSIKYEIKCIEYATNQTELYESLDRIATRYEDILFCCDCNEQEIIYLSSLSNLINGK